MSNSIVFESAESLEGFWARVDKSGECWEWQGAKTNGGYGRIVKNGKAIRAHRVSHELVHGPIGDSKLFVCHRCDNPKCVNPDHLFLGDCKANLSDMTAKGRHPEQVRTHCDHGHEYTTENTLLSIKKGKPLRVCRQCNSARNKAYKEKVRHSA